MKTFKRLLAGAAVALGLCQAAPASVVGFQYIAHIDAVDVSGSPPAGTLPAGVGNAVVGVFAYETTLAPDPAMLPAGFYTYQLPASLVAHRVRFQLPTPIAFLFDKVDIIVVDDHPLDGPPSALDEFVIGSDNGFPSSLPVLETHFLLGHVGPAGTPIGPFDSIALPTTPPKISDFPSFNEWSFRISSPGSVPFEQAWSMEFTGHLVALDVAPLPEPPTAWLVVPALFAAAFWGAGRRARRMPAIASRLRA